jgi:hypothetical protein
MVLLSSVTAPLRASNCPVMDAPVFAVMLVNAYTCPMKVEFTPIVAELPTRQYTLQACAPLANVMVLSTDVIAVESA